MPNQATVERKITVEKSIRGASDFHDYTTSGTERKASFLPPVRALPPLRRLNPEIRPIDAILNALGNISGHGDKSFGEVRYLSERMPKSFDLFLTVNPEALRDALDDLRRSGRKIVISAEEMAKDPRAIIGEDGVARVRCFREGNNPQDPDTWDLVPLRQIYGDGVYELSADDIERVISSHEIRTTLPVRFFDGLQHALKLQGYYGSPANAGPLERLDPAKYGNICDFIDSVKRDPRAYGFENPASLDAVLRCDFEQIGAMVVHSELNFNILDTNNKIINRKADTPDGIARIIDFAGVQSFNNRGLSLAEGTPDFQAAHAEDFLIQSRGFEMVFDIAKGSTVTTAGVGTGVWGQPVKSCWKNLYEGLYRHIQKTERSPQDRVKQVIVIAVGRSAEMLRTARDDFFAAHPDAQRDLFDSIVVNLPDQAKDMESVVRELGKALPTEIPCQVNASDSCVTLGLVKGQFFLARGGMRPTTEENIAAAGTTILTHHDIVSSRPDYKTKVIGVRADGSTVTLADEEHRLGPLPPLPPSRPSTVSPLPVPQTVFTFKQMAREAVYLLRLGPPNFTELSRNLVYLAEQLQQLHTRVNTSARETENITKKVMEIVKAALVGADILTKSDVETPELTLGQIITKVNERAQVLAAIAASPTASLLRTSADVMNAAKHVADVSSAKTLSPTDLLQKLKDVALVMQYLRLSDSDKNIITAEVKKNLSGIAGLLTPAQVSKPDLTMQEIITQVDAEIKRAPTLDGLINEWKARAQMLVDALARDGGNCAEALMKFHEDRKKVPFGFIRLNEALLSTNEILRSGMIKLFPDIAQAAELSKPDFNIRDLITIVRQKGPYRAPEPAPSSTPPIPAVPAPPPPPAPAPATAAAVSPAPPSAPGTVFPEPVQRILAEPIPLKAAGTNELAKGGLINQIQRLITTYIASCRGAVVAQDLAELLNREADKLIGKVQNPDGTTSIIAKYTCDGKATSSKAYIGAVEAALLFSGLTRHSDETNTFPPTSPGERETSRLARFIVGRTYDWTVTQRISERLDSNTNLAMIYNLSREDLGQRLTQLRAEIEGQGLIFAPGQYERCVYDAIERANSNLKKQIDEMAKKGSLTREILEVQKKFHAIPLFDTLAKNAERQRKPLLSLIIEQVGMGPRGKER